MKRLALITLLAASIAHAGWWRTYGGSGWEQGRCVQEIEDGYVVTGFSHPNTPTHSALWLLNVDTSGNIKWSKEYGGTEELPSQGNFVRQTLDGGYIVTGWKWTDSRQIWLIKTDAKGDTLWTHTYGSSIGHCVQQTQDGGYILVGRKDVFPDRLFLLKTNSQGDSTWMRTYLVGSFAFSMGTFIEETEDSGFIIAGLIGDTMDVQDKNAIWLLKTDSTGNTQWSYIQGGINWGDRDMARCVREIGDGNYIALSNLGLLKLNSVGDTLWTREYLNGGSVDVTTDSGYILAGEAGGLSAASLSSVMPQPSWLYKTDGQGDSLWKQVYQAGLSYYVEETWDKGFIVTGGDLANGDLFLLKTDYLGSIGITENPIVEADCGWNVPHSIGCYIVLHYKGLPQGFRANVFDVTGRKVDQIKGDGNEGAMTWGINYPPGVYFIQALDNQNQLKTAKVVLVR